MYFPAYLELAGEADLQASTWLVYMALRPPRLDFTEARDVKAWAVAEELEMSPRTVRCALDWLAQRGYLISHGRGARGVRSMRLAYAIPGENETASQ